MSALIVLTPEELDLVLVGSIDEPGYQAFPNSRRVNAERQEELDAEREGREPRDILAPAAESFERLLSARYWARYATDLALLVSPSTYREAPSSVVALARVAGDRRGAADGTRWVKVGPWHLLDVAVPLSQVESALAPRHVEWLRARLAGRVRPLQPTLGSAVNGVLAPLVDDYAGVVRRLTRPVRTRRRRESLERRDANSTALSMLTRNWRGLTPVANPQPTQLARTFDAALAGSENDLITDDTVVFEDWARGARSVNGWWEFHHGSRRMLVKNVNVSSAETTTGADLVYVRTQPDAVVLVQYKLLAERAGGAPYVAVDRRLRGQLDRMLSFATVPATPTALEDYRLGQGFAYVKFVDPQGRAGLEDTELTRGWYLPAEYVKAILDSGPHGPRGGDSFDIDPERAMEPSTFTNLVRKAWIGSTADATTLLHDIVRPQSATLTIALDQPDTAD